MEKSGAERWFERHHHYIKYMVNVQSTTAMGNFFSQWIYPAAGLSQVGLSDVHLHN